MRAWHLLGEEGWQNILKRKRYNKLELVVKKQTVLYVLLIFPILKINYLLHFPLFTLIYQLILLFDLVYCVILYLKRKQTPAEFVVLFLLLEIWLYIQTYIKQGDLPEVMRVALRSWQCFNIVALSSGGCCLDLFDFVRK